MELVLGLVLFIIVAAVIFFAVQSKSALDIFNNVPKINVKEDDIMSVYTSPKESAIEVTTHVPEKEKMDSPKLVKVEGGADKSKVKPTTKGKPRMAKGKPQVAKNKSTPAKSKATPVNTPVNKKKKI